MRIALLSPKGPLYRHKGGVFKKSLRYAPLTLPTLAALIPPELDAEVVVHDEGIEDIPLDLEADLVGMTVITGTAPRSYELARHFRDRGIPVVLGGPHVTLVPEDAAPHADAVVVGYAEETWPELLRDLAAGRMKARYDQREDLDIGGFPFARRDLMPADRYLTNNVFEATRACIHACEFCVVPFAWGKKPFQKPIDEVVEEVRSTGARTALFLDLNIIADREYAARLFEALMPLGIQWYGLATSLLARDPELLELCARSGCRGLLVGFESISKKNLIRTRKGFNEPGRFVEEVATFHRAGIAIQGCFVFGLDGDEPDVFEKTAELAIAARIDLPRFAIATPFPGTALYQRLASEDRILHRDWEQYDGQHVVFEPRGMTKAQLEEGTRRAWARAYSAVGMTRRLWHSPGPMSVMIPANLGYRFYGRNLRRFYSCDRPIATGAARRAA